MFRWALVSNTTIAPLISRLKSEVQSCGCDCEFFVAEHGDAGRQILSPQSELYSFKPDLLALYLDIQQVRPGLEFTLALENASRCEAIVSEVVEHVILMVTALRDNCVAQLLINSFTVIPRTVMGVGLDPIYRNAVRRINLKLDEALANIPQCRIYDCESLWAEVGFQQYDRRFEMMAQFPFGVLMQQNLVGEWMRFFRALRGLSRKCVVVDLDNTLWGGVLGEDGPEGIQMGDTPQGRPFRRLQESLKALSRRGVILAINSKNNSADVLPVLHQHPDMVLKETDFAVMQINWDDKATNMSRIGRELNIGLRHMVFLDDSASERDWVRQRHAEVLVPELPKEKSGYADVLLRCELDTLAVTDEDRKRTTMYSQEKQRRDSQAEAPSLEEFLKSLNLVVEVQSLRSELLDRAAQLCLRTNQFNLTTRRHGPEKLKQLASGDKSEVFMMKAADRFGDYGWSGLVIAEIQGESVFIESFLMSCRVMGKNVEFALMSVLCQWATKRGCSTIRGLFIPASKNAPCKEFLAKCGLTANGSATAAGGQMFEAEISKLQLEPADHVKISVNAAEKWKIT
jgi:FkbH-like protein